MEAEELFTALLALRNAVGLLAEQYDPTTGRQLGNIPQAFSHFPLVTSALQLAAGRAHRSDEPLARGGLTDGPRPDPGRDDLTARDSAVPGPRPRSSAQAP